MLPHRREALSPVNLDTDTQKTGQGSPQHTLASIGFSEIRSKFCIFSPLQNPLLSFVDQHQALLFAASRPASRPFTRQSITAQAPIRTAP